MIKKSENIYDKKLGIIVDRKNIADFFYNLNRRSRVIMSLRTQNKSSD